MAKVLIVEDETDLREIWMEELSQAGNSVWSAADGQEASRMVETHVFDLVLLDIELPRRSGLEVLQEIRSRDTRLPVVVITAVTSPTVARAVVAAGASDILFKPITLADLTDIVTRLAR